MKGHNDIGWVKFVAVAAMLSFFVSWLLEVNGFVTIQVTGQPTIDQLTAGLKECNAKFLEKCPSCPEVRCGNQDYTLPVFLTGLGFGCLGGIILYTNVNRAWRKESNKKELKKEAIHEKGD